MSIPIQIVNPITYPGWDDLLLSTSGYSFFHSSAWAKVLSESYGYTPLYFTVIENEKLRALVPLMEVKSILTGKRGVSLPFTDYCEPMMDKGLPFQEMLDNIIEYGKEQGWRYFEFRGGQCLLSNTQPSVRYFRHTLDFTASAEEIFRTFRKGTKSSIKKAEKEKVEIRIDNSEDGINEFYQLNCLTRKVHGLPPQPLTFFQNTYRYVLREGMGIVILASYRGINIAGGIFFHFGDKLIYKYGASKREYQELSANNLIVWSSIKHYVKKGVANLCFGRTDLGNEGLRIFKNGWGTEEHILNYYKYDMRRSGFMIDQEKVSRFQNMIFEKTPISLLKIIGAISYKHVG
jgi:hypothetical protein